MIKKDIRVHTKLKESDFIKLCELADDYGFDSWYDLFYSLIKLLLKVAFPLPYEGQLKETPKELEDMINEFLLYPKTNPQFLTYKDLSSVKKKYIKVADRIKTESV